MVRGIGLEGFFLFIYFFSLIYVQREQVLNHPQKSGNIKKAVHHLLLPRCSFPAISQPCEPSAFFGRNHTRLGPN